RLRPTTDEPEAKWIEYEIGSGTFAIGSYGDQWKPGVANSGTMVAFEIDDLDEMMERVKKSGATVAMDLMDSPVCRFGVVLDPDGNAVMLHKRNES
nr:VOC family protein [Chthoniobacterales bacterium]